MSRQGQHAGSMLDNSMLGLMFAIPGLAIALLVGLWYLLMKRRDR